MHYEEWNDHYLSQFTHFQVQHDEKGELKCFIYIGRDSGEDNIIEGLNHEFLHGLLYLLEGAVCCHSMENLWYKYQNDSTSLNLIRLLSDLSYSGIGYPRINGL